MHWIKIPVIDGETTVMKMINLALYQQLQSVSEGAQAQLSGPYAAGHGGGGPIEIGPVAPGPSSIIIDVYFEILIRERQFRSIPGWILVTVEEEEILINTAFYKTIQPDGDGTKFIENDDETSITVTEPYADITKMLSPVIMGETVVVSE